MMNVSSADGASGRRAGIRCRHILSEGESLGQHAAAAAQRALEMAGVSAADVDMVILSTSSPDDIFGSACQVRRGLSEKMERGTATSCCIDFELGNRLSIPGPSPLMAKLTGGVCDLAPL